MFFIAAFSGLVFIGAFTPLKTTRPNAESCEPNNVTLVRVAGYGSASPWELSPTPTRP